MDDFSTPIKEFEGLTKYEFDGILKKIAPATLAGRIVDEKHPNYVIIICDPGDSHNKLAYYTDERRAQINFGIYWDSTRSLSDGVLRTYEVMDYGRHTSRVKDTTTEFHKDVQRAFLVKELGNL